MAKRFTDTSKWKDTWFQDLPNKYKLFWIYLLDDCDNAGLWKPNMRLASFQIGEPFEESEVKRVFQNRIEVTEKGYWFIKKFIDFQYGELSEKSKPHVSVINLLRAHNIGYPKGMHTLKDKEQDKEEDKDKTIPILGSGKYFVLVLPKNPNEQKYKISGQSGLQEYFELNQSVIAGHQMPFVEKYLRDNNGKHLNDFSHVWNDFTGYVNRSHK